MSYLLRTMMMRVLAMLVKGRTTAPAENNADESVGNNDDESVGNAGEIRMNYLLRTMMMRVLAMLVMKISSGMRPPYRGTTRSRGPSQVELFIT
jgi:hypothetical protein